MSKHICTYCLKLKECDWKCLEQCKKEADHYNHQAEIEEALSMYENGQESG